MNSEDSLSHPKPSALRKWRRLILLVLVFPAMVLGFAWIANEMRSKSAWLRYREAAVAGGKSLEWQEPSAGEIPAEQNLAAIPLFADRVAEVRSKGIATDPLAFSRLGQPRDDVLLRDHAEYLTECRRALTNASLLSFTSHTDAPARDILRAFAGFEPELQRLREARSRPHCWFPIFWSAKYAEFPHLGVVNSIGQLLKLRMVCSLSLNDSASAAEDFRDGLRLYRGLRNGPSFISSLVRLALLSQLRTAVQFGVIQRRWTDAELSEIAKDFGALNVLADHADGLETERGFISDSGARFRALSAWERIKQTRETAESGQMLVEVPQLNALSAALLSLGDAWCYDTEVGQFAALAHARAQIDPKQQLLINGNVDPLLEMSEWKQAYFAGGVRLAKLAQSMSERTAHLQTQIAHLQIACALELWRSGRSEYPDTLGALVPEFLASLPRDVIGGGTMRYRRNEDGTFLLYSVGLNGDDEGGRTDPDSKLAGTRTQRDWVWAAPLK